MPRWKPEPVARLMEAALDLFDERGYGNTTVADIADRAGLSKSTFFRHFPEKREVLFGDNALAEVAVGAAAAAPDRASATQVVTEAIHSAATAVFTQDRHDFIARRATVIAATPELIEREALKELSLLASLTTALRQRGMTDIDAQVAIRLGTFALRIAYERWSAPHYDNDFADALKSAVQQVWSAAG